jgi:hypothetical protein
MLPYLTGSRPEPFGLIGLLFVQQPVAERVLAGQVRADAEIPGGLPGQHRVLMITEDEATCFICRANRLAGRPAAGRVASAV